MTVVARWVGVSQHDVERLNIRCRQVWKDWDTYPDCPYSVDWYAEGRTSRMDTWFSLRVMGGDRHEIVLYLPDRKTLAEIDAVRWMGEPLSLISQPDGVDIMYHYHPRLMAKPSWFKRLINFFKRT